MSLMPLPCSTPGIALPRRPAPGSLDATPTGDSGFWRLCMRSRHENKVEPNDNISSIFRFLRPRGPQPREEHRLEAHGNTRIAKSWLVWDNDHDQPSDTK